jgi:hypothetical protein
MRGWWEGRMTRGRWLAVAATMIVVAVLLIVVRLLTGGDASTAAGPPPAYDPPATFATDRGVGLPRAAAADPLPLVLVGFDAVIALPDSLQVVDTRTGDVRVTVPVLPGPSEVQVTGTEPTTPVLATVAGRPAVVAAFQVSVPGHGTTLGHQAVELVTVAQTGYAPVARARIDLPVSLADPVALRSVQVVGADAGRLVVVVRQGSDQVPTSYVVDPVSGKVGWQLAGFEADAVVTHRVVGVLGGSGGGTGGIDTNYRVAAVGVDDGRQVWTVAGSPARAASVWAAGPALVATSVTDAVTGARTLSMVDVATGTVRGSWPAEGGVTCRFDERSSTVCAEAESGQAWAAGYDAVSGRLLWQLPDAAAGRVAPQVSTVWHGVLYGSTENGPVALDARTGADRPVSPGAVPALVNAYVGISAATISTPRPMAYNATS